TDDAFGPTRPLAHLETDGPILPTDTWHGPYRCNTLTIASNIPAPPFRPSRYIQSLPCSTPPIAPKFGAIHAVHRHLDGAAFFLPFFLRIPVLASARLNSFATDCGMLALLAKAGLWAAAAINRACFGDVEGMAYLLPGWPTYAVVSWRIISWFCFII